jgi:hypothetical protein
MYHPMRKPDNFKHAFSEFYPDYFTATILERKHLLKEDKYKEIII